MTATAINTVTGSKGNALTVTPTALAASMSIDLTHEPAILHIHNADATHALTVVATAGTGPAHSAANITWTVAEATDAYIVLPESGDVEDSAGLIQLTITVATGGALTSSTAHVIAGKA